MLLFLIPILMVSAIYFITAGILESSDKRLQLAAAESTTQQERRSQFSSPLFLASKKVSSTINKPFLKLAYLKKLQNNMDFLRLPFGAIELLLVKELLMILVGILVSVLFLPRYAIIGAFAGFFLPDVLLMNKVRAKKEIIIKYFPETVDLMDLCIGAGLDFLSSLRWITEKSLSNQFIEQLAEVVGEIRVGKSRSDALRSMAERLKIPDITSFSRTIIQAERMGTPIEEALRNLSEDTRNNRFQRGERYAIKASLKILFPLLFCILPVIMIVVAGPIIIKFSSGSLFPAGM